MYICPNFSIIKSIRILLRCIQNIVTFTTVSNPKLAKSPSDLHEVVYIDSSFYCRMWLKCSSTGYMRAAKDIRKSKHQRAEWNVCAGMIRASRIYVRGDMARIELFRSNLLSGIDGWSAIKAAVTPSHRSVR